MLRPTPACVLFTNESRPVAADTVTNTSEPVKMTSDDVAVSFVLVEVTLPPCGAALTESRYVSKPSAGALAKKVSVFSAAESSFESERRKCHFF